MHARANNAPVGRAGALDEIAALPGHMRQRVRRAVSELRETPRPSYSKALEIPADLEFEGREEYWK
jgi:hypothetical protein